MQTVVNMLFLSAFYMSFAIGLALVFGVMRTINYAHGALYMLGGYVLYFTYSLLHGVIPNAWIFASSLVAAAVLVGLLGALIERLIIEPLKDQPFSIFMATFGLAYIIQALALKIAGPVGKSISPIFPGIIRLYGAVIPYQRLVVLCMIFLVFGLLWMFLSQTKTGRAIRATAQNSTGAKLQGIALPWVRVITMIIGAGLAGLSGVLMGSVVSITPFMGGEAIWFAFIVIIVGGVGSLPGAVVAAFLFGTLNTLLTSFGHGQLVGMIDAIIMLLILSVVPNGLLGVKE